MSTASSPAPIDSQQILTALQRLDSGDLTVQLPDAEGTEGEIARVFNSHVQMLNQFASELTRLSREMGTEGRYGGQMEVLTAKGTWKDLIANANTAWGTLTNQIRSVAQVVTAIALGRLDTRLTVPAQGEMAELKATMNVMADQMSAMTSEVRRIAREMGSESRYGGQAEVRGIDGDWKRMVDDVNTMAARLTDQIRDIGNISRAAANHDFSRRLSAPADGEMAAIQQTVNGVLDSM